MHAANQYILVLLLLLPFCVYAAQEKSEELQLLTYQNPPYVYMSEGSSYAKKQPGKRGLAIQVVDMMMWRAKVPYSLKTVPIKRGLLMSLTQENTCVFPIERSQEREVQFSWISPVIISRHGFFKRSDAKSANIRTMTDALPLNIGSFLGSGLGEYLESLNFKVDYASSNDANLQKLKAGRIDLWASDILSAKYLAHAQGMQLGAPELVFFTTLKGMACHPNVPEKTIQTLNQTLQSLYQDGSIERIQKNFAAKP